MRWVDVSAGIVILAFGTGTMEGLARGAGGAAVIGGAIVGAVVAGVALVVSVAERGVRRLLPTAGRGWSLAATIGLGLFVAGELMLARGLLRFRDPTLVALVAAIGGVVIAWLCAAIAAPIVVRVAGARPRIAGRGAALLRGAAALLVLVGVIGLGLHARRSERPKGAVAAGAVDLVQAIGDVDGDGDGVAFPPRDCAPLSPAIDAQACRPR